MVDPDGMDTVWHWEKRQGKRILVADRGDTVKSLYDFLELREGYFAHQAFEAQGKIDQQGHVVHNAWIWEEAIHRRAAAFRKEQGGGSLVSLATNAATALGAKYVSQIGRSITNSFARMLGNSSEPLIEHMALGLSRSAEHSGVLVNRFAQQLSSTTGLQIKSFMQVLGGGSGNMQVLELQISSTMKNAKTLHFNLSGMSNLTESFQKGVKFNGSPNITNWEFNQVVNHYLDKTTFYLNGVVKDKQWVLSQINK